MQTETRGRVVFRRIPAVAYSLIGYKQSTEINFALSFIAFQGKFFKINILLIKF